MWDNWAISLGSLAVLLIAALYIPKIWLPIIPFTFAYLLSARLKFESGRQKIIGCNLIVWTMVWILLWSAAIMVTIDLLYAKWFISPDYPSIPVRPKHPYICSLIIWPVSVVVTIYMLLRKRKGAHCRKCQARFGYYSIEDKGVSMLYYNEARYQLRMLLWLSLLLSVVGWFYYFRYYINVNYNSPDRFFYNIAPVSLYVVSLVYMTIRYMAMSDELSGQSSDKPIKPMMSLIRYLVFAGDSVFLGPDNQGHINTPAKKSVPRRDEMSNLEAKRIFEGLTDEEEFDIKYLYTDSGFATGANVFHYAVFLPQENNLSLPGAWLTIDELDRQIKAGNIAPMLSSEISRIYRVTMAWKTYDRDGRRLYPIKNYQPTFRMRDLKDWSVDYNDLSWLDIAANNEDRAFFKFRRFWQKNFRH